MAEQVYNSVHTGQQIDEAVSWLQAHAADQICGGAVSGTTIATPDNPTYWFAPQGTYTCGGSTITISSGNLGIISYDGSQWSSISFYVSACPIVNDLITGGINAALSAEMGKKLNETKAGVTNGNDIITNVTLLDASMRCYLFSPAVRYFCAYSVPIKKGIKVKVEGVPSAYNFGIGSRSNWADALNAGNVLPTETTDWNTGTAEYTFTNDASLYLVIPFKKTNNGNLSSSDTNAINNATKITIYDKEKVLTIGGENFNPVTDASFVKYGDSNVADVLAVNDIVWSEVLAYVNATTQKQIRVAFLAEIPRGLIDIKCDITLPSTFRFATKTISNLTNAYNDLYVTANTFYDSGWVTNGKYHATIYNDTHKYLALVWSKENNAIIDVEEIRDLANAFKVTKVDMPVGTSLNENGALMVAHRGTHYFDIPENSIPAFDLAGKLGYDYVEADIRRTSDGKYVVMHDASINRTCENANGTAISGTVNVASTTFDTLRTNYRLKSNNPDYRLPIPSLEEYLYAVKRNGSKASAEILVDNNAQAKEIYDICKEIMGDGNWIHSSVYYAQLDYIRSIDDKILLCYGTTQILDTTSTVDGSSRNHPRNEQQSNYDGSYFTFTKELVRSYHEKGMMVGAWTIPSENYSFGLDVGLDIIVTNDIAPVMRNANAVEMIFDRKHRIDNYVTDGTTSEDGITLANGDTITFDSFSFDRGFLLMEVEGSGDFTITTNTQKLVSAGAGNTYSPISKSVSSEDVTKTTIKALYCCNVVANSLNLQVTPKITATGNAFVRSVKIYNVKV